MGRRGPRRRPATRTTRPGKTTVGSLPSKAQRLRREAISAIAAAEQSFARFDFIRATFSAQTAWREAAAYRDLALGLAPGTSELQRGTKKEGASSCPSSYELTAGATALAPHVLPGRCGPAAAGPQRVDERSTIGGNPCASSFSPRSQRRSPPAFPRWRRSPGRATAPTRCATSRSRARSSPHRGSSHGRARTSSMWRTSAASWARTSSSSRARTSPAGRTTTRSSARWVRVSASSTSPSPPRPTAAGGYVDSGWQNDVQVAGDLVVSTFDGVSGEDSSASTCLKTRYPDADGQGVDIYRLQFNQLTATFETNLLTCVANPPGGAHNSTIHPGSDWLGDLGLLLGLGDRRDRPARRALGRRAGAPVQADRRVPRRLGRTVPRRARASPAS